MRCTIVACYRLAGWLNRHGLFRPAVALVFLADRLARLSPAPLLPPRPGVDVDALRVPTLVVWDLRAVAHGERLREGFRGREGRA